MQYPAEVAATLPDDAKCLTVHHAHAHKQARKRAAIRDHATRELGLLGFSWRETVELLDFAREYDAAGEEDRAMMRPIAPPTAAERAAMAEAIPY